jgi:hypothetical protein
MTIITASGVRPTPPREVELEPIHATIGDHFGIAWFITFVVCCLLLLPTTLLYVNYYDQTEPAWIRNLYFQKSLILCRMDPAKPRLIFFGGSGVLFGVDARLVEKKLGVPTLNFGTQGGMGVRYTLDYALSVLRPGDTGVVIIEYGSYADRWRVHPGTFHDYIWTYDRDYFHKLPLRELAMELWSVRLMDYVNSWPGWNEWASNDYFHLQQLAKYSVGTIDDRGDIHVLATTPVQQYDGPPFYDNPGAYDIAAYRDFAAQAKARNIRVMFSWPAYIRPKLSPGQTLDAPAYMTKLFRETSLIDLDQPADDMYPTDFFLDSSYHLNPAARRLHTEELIRRIRPFYGLPPASGEVKQVLLVAGRDQDLTPGNLFLDDANLSVRYLLPGSSNDPRTISAAGVADLLRSGVRVFTDSEDAGPLLTAAGMTEKISDTGHETISHWFSRYPSNLMLIGAAPGRRLDPAWKSVLPPDVFAVISAGKPVAAIYGTGAYARVKRIISRNDSASLVADTPDLLPPASRMPAHLEIEATANHLRLAVDYLDTAKRSSGLCAIALDPELGAIAGSQAFDGSADVQTWQIDQVVLAAAGN